MADDQRAACVLVWRLYLLLLRLEEDRAVRAAMMLFCFISAVMLERPVVCGSVEVDHQHGLPFNERAHLMSLAMKMDDDDFIPWTGCCCNDP